MKKENYENDILKADLLLSDYTLAEGDAEEQKIYIDLLDKYVMRLEDPTITALFINLTSTNKEDEREIYTQILVDTLEDKKREVLGYGE